MTYVTDVHGFLNSADAVTDAAEFISAFTAAGGVMYPVTTAATAMVSDVRPLAEGELDQSLELKKFSMLNPGEYDDIAGFLAQNYKGAAIQNVGISTYLPAPGPGQAFDPFTNTMKNVVITQQQSDDYAAARYFSLFVEAK